jgi:hypothetical protein
LIVQRECKTVLDIVLGNARIQFDEG